MVVGVSFNGDIVKWRKKKLSFFYRKMYEAVLKTVLKELLVAASYCEDRIGPAGLKNPVQLHLSTGPY